MASTFTVPSSLSRAKSELVGLDSLVTASEWQRAAIVYAFTHKGTNRYDVAHENSCTIREFASLGISGLRTQDTVRRYRDAWQQAVDKGLAKPATPGENVRLPAIPFPPHVEVENEDRRGALNAAADAEGAGRRSTQQIATHLPALRAAIKADPKVAAAALEALDSRRTAPRAADSPTSHDEGLSLLVDFRRLHRTVEAIARRVINGTTLIVRNERKALLDEVEWLRAALDHIESGLASGSLDAELAAFMDAEA